MRFDKHDEGKSEDSSLGDTPHYETRTVRGPRRSRQDSACSVPTRRSGGTIGDRMPRSGRAPGTPMGCATARSTAAGGRSNPINQCMGWANGWTEWYAFRYAYVQILRYALNLRVECDYENELWFHLSFYPLTACGDDNYNPRGHRLWFAWDY